MLNVNLPIEYFDSGRDDKDDKCSLNQIFFDLETQRNLNRQDVRIINNIDSRFSFRHKTVKNALTLRLNRTK